MNCKELPQFFICIDQGVSIFFFYKGPESIYFRFPGHIIPVIAIKLSSYSTKAVNRYPHSSLHSYMSLRPATMRLYHEPFIQILSQCNNPKLFISFHCLYSLCIFEIVEQLLLLLRTDPPVCLLFLPGS